MTLPAEGPQGDAPEFPLADPTGRELALWAVEWRRPQAVMWGHNGQEVEVALYVRALVDAERHGATVASRTLVRQLQEALGLSQPGLARNRWRIGDVAGVAAEGSARRPAAGGGARDRFKVVPGGS